MSDTIREIPLTKNQAKLLDSIRAESEKKAQMVNQEYQAKLTLTAQGIVAGADLDENAEYVIEGWESGDSPHLKISIK